MARIKLQPPEKVLFGMEMPVRITDVNYGGHVGNHCFPAYLHEARLAFLKALGYSEMDVEGYGLIMADLALQFRSELFHGETLIIELGISAWNIMGFELCYQLKTKADGRLVALATTQMVCFDYKERSMKALPAGVREKLEQ